MKSRIALPSSRHSASLIVNGPVAAPVVVDHVLEDERLLGDERPDHQLRGVARPLQQPVAGAPVRLHAEAVAQLDHPQLRRAGSRASASVSASVISGVRELRGEDVGDRLDQLAARVELDRREPDALVEDRARLGGHAARHRAPDVHQVPDLGREARRSRPRRRSAAGPACRACAARRPRTGRGRSASGRRRARGPRAGTGSAKKSSSGQPNCPASIRPWPSESSGNESCSSRITVDIAARKITASISRRMFLSAFSMMSITIGDSACSRAGSSCSRRITRFSRSSTSTTEPGSTTVVESSWTTIAGPSRR